MSKTSIQIDFHYVGTIISIECSIDEIIQEIYNNFCSKLSLNIKTLIFLYDGKQIDNKLSLKKIINSDDKKRKKMNILVYSLNEKDINQNKQSTNGEQTICPKCGENAKIKFKDYHITIHGCKNNHITENILLEQYQNTQIIDENKIICGLQKRK